MSWETAKRKMDAMLELLVVLDKRVEIAEGKFF